MGAISKNEKSVTFRSGDRQAGHIELTRGIADGAVSIYERRGPGKITDVTDNAGYSKSTSRQGANEEPKRTYAVALSITFAAVSGVGSWEGGGTVP